MRSPAHALRALLVALAASAAFPAQAGPDDTPVAHVGPVTITRGELERRMARIPAIQLSTLGRDKESVTRAFLEKILIPEVLLSQGARDQKLDLRDDVRLRIEDTLRGALVAAVRKEYTDGSGVSTEEVARYYAEHLDKFQTPERLNLSRILLGTREEAAKVLEELKAPGGDKKWKDTARDRSLDKATSERGGALGFVAADGSSSEATVHAEPALYEAAHRVQNGEFVPEPVPEGKGFAVVWRRGSTPPVHRSLEQEGPAIRGALAKQRSEAAVKALLEKLHKELLSDVSYDLLTVIEVNSSGEVTPRKRPGVAHPKALGKPQPSGGPDGLR